jgi:hypothetical protein
MTETEERFIKNENQLAESFSFEKLGEQLNFISRCSENWVTAVPNHLKSKAEILYQHLVKFGFKNQSLKTSLVYHQSRSLIDDVVALMSRR